MYDTEESMGYEKRDASYTFRLPNSLKKWLKAKDGQDSQDKSAADYLNKLLERERAKEQKRKSGK